MNTGTDYQEIISYARGEFRDYAPVLIEHSNGTQEITFAKKGCNYNFFNFILSKQYIFVTGDICEAIYKFPEPIRIQNIDDTYNLHMLNSNLIATKNNLQYFDNEIAFYSIKENLENLGCVNFDSKECVSLLEAAKSCCSISEWVRDLFAIEGLDSLDKYWYRWLPNIGTRLNTDYVLCWIALRTCHNILCEKSDNV